MTQPFECEVRFGIDDIEDFHARRDHRDTAVKPVHSRGVVGVMPGGAPQIADSLEGASSQLSGADQVRAIL